MAAKSLPSGDEIRTVPVGAAGMLAAGPVIGVESEIPVTMTTLITKAAHRLRPRFTANIDPYVWLEAMAPGLMLDVGAAAGWIVAKMLQASPQSRVVAFEPYPGNHRFIDERFGADSRVRIFKKAVSNNNRPAKFYVSTTIENGIGEWAGMDGYSSAGFIISAKDQRAEHTITVPTCRLDDEINEPVRFLKMDVQGGEFRVLDGAKRLFDHHGVELVVTEFMGDRRIIDFLAEREYAILDTGYHSTRGPLDPEKWHTIGSEQLSTGQETPIVEPFSAPDSPDAYATWFAAERQRYVSLWTDLIAIAPWSDLLRARWSWRRLVGLAPKPA